MTGFRHNVFAQMRGLCVSDVAAECISVPKNMDFFNVPPFWWCESYQRRNGPLIPRAAARCARRSDAESGLLGVSRADFAAQNRFSLGHSIRCARERVKAKRSGKHRLGLLARQSHPQKGGFRKLLVETMACDESSITAACYLCNTLPKTRCTTRFKAVPLLRVHFPSVIVSVRRRGASRSRPV